MRNNNNKVLIIRLDALDGVLYFGLLLRYFLMPCCFCSAKMIQNNNKANKTEEKEENLEGERANVDHVDEWVRWLRMKKSRSRSKASQNIS